MSSYLPYNFDFSPRADVFIPDFNFYTNALGIATQRYNAAVQQAGQVLGRYFLAELSNEENVKFRENYYNGIKNQISKIAATDLSDPVNFSKLQTLVEDISNDEDIIKDMNFTQSYLRNKSYLESLRFNVPDISTGEGKIEGHNYLTYDKNMAELLEFERAEFASQKRGSIKAMQSSSVYGLDYVRMANDYLKSLGIKFETIQFLGPTVVDQPSFIVKTDMGELADYNVSNALNRFLQNNQIAKEYFTNQSRHDVYKFEALNNKDITQTGVDLLNRLNQHRLTNYDLIKTSVDKSNIAAEEKEKIKAQIEALLAGGSLDGAIKAQDLVRRYEQLDKNQNEINKTKEETDRITSYVDELTRMANAEINANKALSQETYNKIKMAYLNLQPTLRINEESFKIGYDWVQTHISKTINENALARAHIFGRYGAMSSTAPKTDSSYFVPASESGTSGNHISYYYNTSKEQLDEDILLKRHVLESMRNPNDAKFIQNIDFGKELSRFHIKQLSDADIERIKTKNMDNFNNLESVIQDETIKSLGFTPQFIRSMKDVNTFKGFVKDYISVLQNNNAKLNTSHYSERSGLIYVPNVGVVFMGTNQARLYGRK